MIKDLSGRYVPGKRADSWLKVKKDYVEGLADSLDLVPIGAWHGAGRKAGWFSPFLLAVHDPETGELQSVCRCMSGFTDDFYKAATERLGARVVGAPPSYYVTGERPSVWFVAEEVWEIRGAELPISPVHMAANGKVGTGGRGLALRFPRAVQLHTESERMRSLLPRLRALRRYEPAPLLPTGVLQSMAAEFYPPDAAATPFRRELVRLPALDAPRSNCCPPAVPAGVGSRARAASAARVELGRAFPPVPSQWLQTLPGGVW